MAKVEWEIKGVECEYTVAEMGSASSKTEGPIPLELGDSYAQFNELHLGHGGIIR